MNKPLFLSSLACAIVFSGCAATPSPQREAMLREAQSTVPTCSTARECEVKWAAARNFVNATAGMKIQHLSNDYIETYNSVNGSVALAWRVTKDPVGANGYRITAKAWCANIFGCSPDALQSVVMFNRTVNSSWTPDSTP